ncbi:hypothetical protein GQ457_08G023010 [Hibiscus cannabinus]
MSQPPNLLLMSRRFKDASGRPPDEVPHVPLSPTLERSASPTPLEGQSVVKRSCTREGSEAARESMALDADVDFDLVGSDDDCNVPGDGITYARNTAPLTSGDGLKEGVSYASKVMSNSIDGYGSGSPGKKGPFEDVVSILEDDVILNRAIPIPSIQFSNLVHDQIDHNMRNSIIVRLLGRYIGDYARVLTDGPWTIYGSYLTVQPWSRSFNTSEKFPSQVIVWVRIPGLPYRYYNKALFRYIALLIGKVVRVDYNTQDGARGKFARLAILLQKLEYDGLHNICYSCGVYGHAKELCPRNKDAQVDGMVDSIASTDVASEAISESNLYGPWMMVENRRCRTPGNVRNVSSEVRNWRVSGSWFASLVDEGLDERQLEDSSVVLGTETGGVVVVHEDVENQKGVVHMHVNKTVAFLASNRDKKSKARDKGTKEIGVVPTVEGRSINVILHRTNVASGSHSAIKIVEEGSGDGIRSKASMHGASRKGKAVRDDVRKDLLMKKSGEPFVKKTCVAEWAQNAQMRVDLIAKDVGTDVRGVRELGRDSHNLL